MQSVPVYATGINPDQPEEFALARQKEGHRAFKLKVGFGREIDVNTVACRRSHFVKNSTLNTSLLSNTAA